MFELTGEIPCNLHRIADQIQIDRGFPANLSPLYQTDMVRAFTKEDN